MGVAGVALALAVFSLVKSIPAVALFLKWRSKELVDGKIGKLKKSASIGTNKVLHIYDMVVQSKNGDETIEYAEKVKASAKSALSEGQIIKVYYDSQNKECRDKEKIITEVKVYPALFVGGVILFFLCYFVAAALK